MIQFCYPRFTGPTYDLKTRHSAIAIFWVSAPEMLLPENDTDAQASDVQHHHNVCVKCSACYRLVEVLHLFSGVRGGKKLATMRAPKTRLLMNGSQQMWQLAGTTMTVISAWPRQRF